MNKHASEQPRRRDEILRIVRSGQVHSQEELQSLLLRRGFEATQPTLSRDLRELAIAKTASGYAVIDSAAARGEVVSILTPAARESRLQGALAEFALSVERAGTLVVIRTTVGGAQPLAVAIDSAAPPQVVGTIAGDDTIFLASRTAADATRLVRELREPITTSRRERRARA